MLDSLGTDVLEAGKALVRPAGEARRSTLDSTGAGFEFRADVAWPSVIARLVAPDTLELLLGNTTTTDDRFWRELAFIAGARHEGALASGV